MDEYEYKVYSDKRTFSPTHGLGLKVLPLRFYVQHSLSNSLPGWSVCRPLSNILSIAWTVGKSVPHALSRVIAEAWPALSTAGSFCAVLEGLSQARVRYRFDKQCP